MQRVIFVSTLLLFLSGCVTLPPQVDFSTRTQGGNVGIVNFLPVELIHHHYGILPGLSQYHDHHPAPFDVGGEFAKALSSKINEHTGFKAKVIAAPPAMEQIRFDTTRIGEYSYRNNPPWWNDINRVVYPQFVEVFRELAEQHNLDSFIILSPYWQRPSLNDGLPYSFSYAVQTKNHSPWYFSHTMISAVCLAFDMEHLRARDLCKESPNSIALEDYTAPEDRAAPLPRMEEIGDNLFTLLKGKVIEVVETLNGSEPGSLKEMTFTSRPAISIQAPVAEVATIADVKTDDQPEPVKLDLGTYRSQLSKNLYKFFKNTNIDIRLIQSGDTISGTFVGADGYIDGVIDGNTIKYKANPPYGNWSIRGKWVFSDEFDEALGDAGYHVTKGSWNLTRIE